MPFIESITTQDVSKVVQEKIKQDLAVIMHEEAGKGERFLAIGFRTQEAMFFGGEKVSEFAVVEVKLVGTLESIQKQKIVQRIGVLYEELVGTPQDRMYVVFCEVPGESWGWNGSTFA